MCLALDAASFEHSRSMRCNTPDPSALGQPHANAISIHGECNICFITSKNNLNESSGETIETIETMQGKTDTLRLASLGGRVLPF